MDVNLYNNNSLTVDSFNNIKLTEVIELNPTFLKYSKDLQVIICSSCKSAIINKNSIGKHLKEKHTEFYNSKILEDKDKEVLKELEVIDYKKNKNITNNKYYFKDLPLIFTSYKCVKCNYISLDNKPIRKHLISEHKLKSENTKKSSNIIYNIPIQYLYPNNRDNYGIFIPKLPKLEEDNAVNLINDNKDTLNINTSKNKELLDINSNIATSSEASTSKKDIYTFFKPKELFKDSIYIKSTTNTLSNNSNNNKDREKEIININSSEEEEEVEVEELNITNNSTISKRVSKGK